VVGGELVLGVEEGFGRAHVHTLRREKTPESGGGHRGSDLVLPAPKQVRSTAYPSERIDGTTLRRQRLVGSAPVSQAAGSAKHTRTPPMTSWAR
jgi:hypothetical protein